MAQLQKMPPEEEGQTPSRFDRRKEEILNAAGALFNRHGLRDTTLAIVAADIGLNLKSLRYYFQRKEELVTAAFMRAIDLHKALFDDALEIKEFAPRIRRFVGNYFELQARVRRKEIPQFVHFGDIRALAEPHIDQVGAAYVELFRKTRRLFRNVEVSWVPDQQSANAHMLISQLLWSVIWLDGFAPQDFPRVADRLTDVLLHGLAAGQVSLPASSDALPTPFRPLDPLSQDSFLMAATQLINEMGYRGASVDRISAKLNVSKGAFYHYNETRDDLVVACFERTFEIIRQAQDLALAEQTNGLSHVAAAAASLVSRQMRPEGELLRTSALTAVGPELRQELQRSMSASTLRFSDMLNDGLMDGSVRICDMRIASEMVTAVVNSAQELQRWVPGADASNSVTLYVQPLLNGFLGSVRTPTAA